MGGDKYTHILGNYVKPHVNIYNNIQLILQLYYASVHVSKNTEDRLEGMQINTLTWPIVSSDLNPIENIWGM